MKTIRQIKEKIKQYEIELEIVKKEMGELHSIDDMKEWESHRDKWIELDTSLKELKWIIEK